MSVTWAVQSVAYIRVGDLYKVNVGLLLGAIAVLLSGRSIFLAVKRWWYALNAV